MKPKTHQEVHFYNELKKAKSPEGRNIPSPRMFVFDTSDTRKEHAKEVIDRLVKKYDYSEKQLWYYLEKWADKGWWNYGVSLGTGWFQDNAPERLETIQTPTPSSSVTP